MSLLLDCLKAFIVGGFICMIGQVLIDYTRLTPARILTTYVVTGVALTAVGIYKPIVDFAGAGATVPLTGFGYNLCRGMEKAVSEKGFMGIFTGAFTSASAGLSAAVVFGFLAALIFKPKPKS